MSRQFTRATSLDGLKKEAKRWLKALRSKDAEARVRLEQSYPQAPTEPGLRDVQHALAREYGAAGWAELKQQLTDSAPPLPHDSERIAWFLENACPDHHVRGGPANVMARDTAVRILRRCPEIARENFYTAVVCGDLPEVERILEERPESAREKAPGESHHRDLPGGDDLFRDNGPKTWEPLLFLCFTRLPVAAVNDNAVAIARALLDAGADPNAYFMAGDSFYTPLVGVIGEGEEDRPPHPQREALVRLLLERGAEPYDLQVIYNTHFHADVRWLLELIYAQSVKLGRKADWDDPEWAMLDMGGYSHLILRRAVLRNDLDLAEWVLSHGATPDPARDSTASLRSLYDEALRRGHTAMAELLRRSGANTDQIVPEGAEAFAAACFRLDREETQALIARNPEYLLDPGPLFEAAEHDRADVAELLLDLGMSPDIEDPRQGGQRPLHSAAYSDSPGVVSLLIERGAEIDPVDVTHETTPFGFAVWGQRHRTIELLSCVSRDIWSLTFTGAVERLREVFNAEPERAKVVVNQRTPLMRLCPDEDRAVEIVELFLRLGADPTITDTQGMTAADYARRRGLDEAAALLSRAESGAEANQL